MASELELNRMLSKVQTQNIALLIYGGQDRLNSLRRTWSKIENDPEFNKSNRPFKNHSERYVDACRKKGFTFRGVYQHSAYGTDE